MDAARLLINKGVDSNAKCQIRVQDGLQAELTPLMLAAMWKQNGMVRLLLELSANVSHTGQARIERTVRTAMIAPHLSAILGHEDVTRMLQKADSVKAKMETELTGLHLAVILDDKAVINRFLEHGADPDMRCEVDVEVSHQDNNFNANVQVQLTPLHLTAWAGHETVAVVLMEGGAKVNERIQAGGTAALNFGMRIDQKMQPGATALHVAVGLRKEKVVQVLIDHGADVGAKTRDGRTALQWADGTDGESTAQIIRGGEMDKGPGTAAKDVRKRFMQKLNRFFRTKSEENGNKSRKGR